MFDWATIVGLPNRLPLRPPRLEGLPRIVGLPNRLPAELPLLDVIPRIVELPNRLHAVPPRFDMIPRTGDQSLESTSTESRNAEINAVEETRYPVGDILSSFPRTGRTSGRSHDWRVNGAFENYNLAKDSVLFAAVCSFSRCNCMICESPTRHKMIARYLQCKCQIGCTKYIRILECEFKHYCVLSVSADDRDCVPLTQGRKMTRVLRAKADEMFEFGLTPSRARSKMKSFVPSAQLPSLKEFQNRYRHYRCSKMLEHSSTTVMARTLVEKIFQPNVDDKEYFSFGYVVEDGHPHICYGGASGAFKVGITTKKLLSQINRDPSAFVFHWDATYKINTKDYPVLICGISDVARQLHPVAFFLFSKESRNEYTWAMNELMLIYKAVVGQPLKIKYTMSDAAIAPMQSIQAYADDIGVEKTLMCFYHCMANVKKHLTGASISTKALVYRHIYNIHYSRSEDEMLHHWLAAQDAWTANTYLVYKGFARYFLGQWIESEFSAWQVFHSPSGFPTTNNPCEAFNKHFKDTYTARTKHGLCSTFKMLGEIAEEYSTFKANEFSLHAAPSNKLVRRTHRLMKFDLLEQIPTNEHLDLPVGEILVRSNVPSSSLTLAYAFEYGSMNATRDEAHAAIQAETAPGSVLSARDADVAKAYYFNSTTNDARHEIVCSGNRQSWYGWRVCTTPGSLRCECNYFYKHAYCCHLVFALTLEQKDMLGRPLPESVFVSSSSNRRASTRGFGGRNRSRVGPAL